MRTTTSCGPMRWIFSCEGRDCGSSFALEQVMCRPMTREKRTSLSPTS